MRYIYTLLLALLLGGIAAQAQETAYQPLVREGVRWHTAYIEVKNPSTICPEYHYIDYRIEFLGDTVLSGVRYKKCYMYDTESWTPGACLVGFAREDSGRVMFVCKYDILVLAESCVVPGEYFDLTGELVIYDFSDMEGFFMGLGNSNQQITSVGSLFVGDAEVTCYFMNGYWLDYRIVEGVGCDKPDHSACPIMPFEDPPTGNVSRWGGLIMQTTLDGELLYKGCFYDKYLRQKTDLTGDGRVDIADVNAAIDVMLGKSASTAADITGDGRVDIADVNAVINVMLGRE